MHWLSSHMHTAKGVPLVRFVSNFKVSHRGSRVGLSSTCIAVVAVPVHMVKVFVCSDPG